MVIQIGKLNKRVTIQQQSASQDSYGQPADTWTTFATRWASVEPLQGKEFYATQQIRAEVTTRFRLRFLAGVTPSMRILYAGRYFNISAVLDVNEKHEELHLMAVEAQ